MTGHQEVALRLRSLNTAVSHLFRELSEWPSPANLLDKTKNLHRTIRDLRVLLNDRAITDLGPEAAQGIYFPQNKEND